MTRPAAGNPAPPRREALAGIEAPRRAQLATLHRTFPGLFNAAQAAAALGTAIEPTRKLLAARRSSSVGHRSGDRRHGPGAGRAGGVLRL